MDWNKIVKAIGDYHGIECYPVETMEEADAQLAELYAKERHTPQEEKPAVFDWCKLEGNVCQYCKSHTHKCPDRIEVTLHDIAMKIRELQKPPANSDMVEELENIKIEHYQNRNIDDMPFIRPGELKRVIDKYKVDFVFVPVVLPDLEAKGIIELSDGIKTDWENIELYAKVRRNR